MNSAQRFNFTWLGISGIGIAIATVTLRFWKLAEMPFSHDEFSALFRSRFADFNSLLELGVKTDTHPPGVQVLYWLIRQFWSEEALAYKLPFAIMGALSVWLFYQIGRHWMSLETASVSSAFLAVSQIAVMQSQQARPYSAGLFFCLLALWAFIRFQQGNRKAWLLLVALSLSLGAYMHHFAALQGGLIFLIALLNSKPDQRKWVLVAGMLSLLIYLPNLSILQQQLKVGGIGTVLAAPDLHFLVQYFQFLGHYSVYFGALLLVGIGMSLYGYFQLKPPVKIVLSLAVLGLLPGIIGALYSIYRAPVLMERSLYFSLPFLVLLLCSGFSFYKQRISAILTMALLILGGLSLILERQHYLMTQQSGYRESLRLADNLNQEGWDTKNVFISGYEPSLEFETSELGLMNSPYTRLDHENEGEPFFKRLVQGQPDQIALGRTMQFFYPDPGYDALCYAKGLSLSDASYWFNSDMRVYQSTGKDLSVYRLEFPENLDSWVYQSSSLQEGIYHMAEGSEWGPTIELDLSALLTHHNNELSAFAEIHTDNPAAEVELVSILSKGDRTVHYHSKSLESSGYPLLSLGLKLADIPENPAELKWKVFLWNRDQRALDVCRLELIILPGNPYQYGWYQKIEP